MFVIAPLFVSNYVLSVLIIVLYFAYVGQAWNLMIGFAGQRVIEQTIRESLPEDFQTSEYLLEHGMVDMVVHRHKLRSTLAELCRLLTKTPAPAKAAPLPPPEAPVQPAAQAQT